MKAPSSTMCVSSVLAARGSSWFGLVPGALLLAVSLVLIIATVGTAGGQPFSPMEHFFVALSVVAAVAVVVLNVVNAGVFVGVCDLHPDPARLRPRVLLPVHA